MDLQQYLRPQLKKFPFLPLNQNIYNPGAKNEERAKEKNDP
jgi:hypothetical protein